MTAFRVASDYYQAYSPGGTLPIVDPGASGTFNLHGRHGCIASVSSGVRKLPDHVPPGIRLLVYATGSVTLQNQLGSTVALLSSGKVAECIATSSTTWVASVYELNPTAIDDSDVAANFGAFTTVEQALERLIIGTFDIPLSAFRETASGDVGNAAANGGLLASDTTPILEGAGATNAQRLNWATGNVDAVTAGIVLPPDVDGTAQVEFELIVAGAGTTNGWTNASGLVTNWDGGANVTDAVADSAATAVHAASATVAASDIPDEPYCLSVTIVPPTHATDALFLLGVRGTYTRRVVT